MIRVPDSYNSKCIQTGKDPEIKIIQKWDGHRPKINLLLGSFYAYDVDQKIEAIRSVKANDISNKFSRNTTTIPWIEKLLQTPIQDYRKNGVSLILAPYLINIRKLSFEEAFTIIQRWLDKCSSIKRRIDFNPNYHIRYHLNYAIRKSSRPLKLETLKAKNKELYTILVE